MSEQPKIVTERELDNEPGHEIMNVSPRCEHTIRTFAAALEHSLTCDVCGDDPHDCVEGVKALDLLRQYHA